MPIIRAMQGIEGYLYDDEADLLLALTVWTVTRFRRPYAVVELGSYCGKSTVVFGMAAKAVRPGVRVYAIDPHEGELSVADQVVQSEPTFARFLRNMESVGVADVVVPIRARSTAVKWTRPIGLLFIDALHDYESVSSDFRHFAPWVVPRGYIAFHDYGKSDFPGVTRFVDEVVGDGGFRPVDRVAGLIVLEKVSRRGNSVDAPFASRRVVAPGRLRPERTSPGRGRTTPRIEGGDPGANAICIESGPEVCLADEIQELRGAHQRSRGEVESRWNKRS
jgi:hypothetical protein